MFSSAVYDQTRVWCIGVETVHQMNSLKFGILNQFRLRDLDMRSADPLVAIVNNMTLICWLSQSRRNRYFLQKSFHRNRNPPTPRDVFLVPPCYTTECLSNNVVRYSRFLEYSKSGWPQPAKLAEFSQPKLFLKPTNTPFPSFCSMSKHFHVFTQ